MSNELGRIAFVLAAVVVVGWFAIGTQLNIRKGHRVLRWLQDGMPLLGERTTLRWLGSSAVELKVQRAIGPLRSAEVVLVLEPRDLPVLWWFFHARGRRDLLIARGDLRAPPRFELEVFDRHAWSIGGMERALQRNGWTTLPMPAGAALVAYAKGRTEAAGNALPVPAPPELSLVRLAVHSGAPHLEIQWELAGFEALDARRVLETLHRLADRL